MRRQYNSPKMSVCELRLADLLATFKSSDDTGIGDGGPGTSGEEADTRKQFFGSDVTLQPWVGPMNRE